MRILLLRVALLLSVIVAVVLAEGSPSAITPRGTTADGCRAFSRCSECVFDSSDGVLTAQLPCQWCVTTGLCLGANSSAAASCPDLRDDTVNPMCPDMSCKAAWTTNNIYICRGASIAGLLFACVLFLFNGLYFLWLKAIWQLPWKYENINKVVAGQVGASGGILFASFAKAQQVVPLRDLEVSRRDNTCPICKVAQANALLPSEVCFWCDVVRYGFAPLYIGLIGSTLSIVLMFALPMKPWFADWYYMVLISSPYISYAVFFAYVYICRVSIVGDTSQKSTMFFQLAWILRGRGLKEVFPLRSEVKMAPVTPAVDKDDASVKGPTPTASVLDEEGEVNLKRIHTLELLNGESVEKEFRRALQKIILPDEYILWHEQPSASDIQADMRWIIHLFYIAIAFGVWLIIAWFLNDTSVPLSRILSNDSLGTSGFAIVFIFSVALVVTYNGCNRMYVMTNKRLLVVARGFQGAHVSPTDISSLKFATVYSYSEKDCGSLRVFCWETPGELRKMPPIATKAFAAIVELEAFLAEFRRFAPAAMMKQELLPVQRENTRHMRQVWRMHILINMVSLAVMPIVVLYSQIVSFGFAVVLLLIVFALNVSILQRGLRWQQMTFVPYRLLQNWSWEAPQDEEESFFDRMLKNGQVHLNQPLRQKIGKLGLTSLSV